MAMRMPKYLQAANIQDNSIRYEWDDWRTLPATETPDKEIGARLQGISQRAELAFMCGTAEWIVHRFARLCDNPARTAFLEAAWAMTVDVHYGEFGEATGWSEYVNNTKAEWNGPVNRPIADALVRLEVAIQKLAQDGTDPVNRAALLATLASYVMSDPAPYKSWCNQVLDRLESLYPLDPEDCLGDVVPREALDPAFDFHVEQTEALINQFLAGLDYHGNIFLSSPEAMLESEYIEETFQGTPYVFDMEADRRARRGERTEEHDE
jgi:hypothetical protein